MTRTLRALALLASLAAAVAAAGAPALGAQEPRPPTGVQRPQAPTPVRTAPGDTVPSAAAAPGDTVPGDTAAPPPELTPRERALERLRAMPTSPIQPDTLAGEGGEGGEGEADEADEAGEAGEAGEDRVEVEVVEPTADAGPPEPVAGGAREADARVARAEGPEVMVKEDSIRRLLASLEGYTRTEYRGEGAVFEGEGSRLNLTGKSRVSRDGSAMETDSLLVYAGDRGIVCGYGNPVLTGDGDPLTSDRVCYDIDRDIGMAEGARTQFVQGATWYVRGEQNRIYLVNERERNALYGERAQFTSCELEEPHYSFQAQSLKMVQGDMMVARNVTLRFADVPVFWLPWMVQSMKPDRRSGLLMPQFGLNDIVRNSSGYNRSVSNLGLFWAINDYMSSQATFEWFSNNYTAVQGNFTYRWLEQFLNGHVTARTYWHDSEFGPGRRDLTVNTANSWRPDERTTIQVSGDYATSTSLVRDFSFDPRELNRQITSSAGVNRSFGWGSTSLSAQRQQNIVDDRINWTLPSLSLSLRPITLFSSDDGSQTLTWSGSGSASRRIRDVNEMLPGASNRDQESIQAGADHSVAFGRLSLRQNVRFTDVTDAFKPALETPPDTVALPELSRQNMDWGSSLSYQISLRPGTTLSPSLSISGEQIRNERTDGAYVAAPNRISTGASLATTIYGFWPGFGDFERIRHKISPGLSWSYSPKPAVSELQDSIFKSFGNLREQNRIGLTFNQTFEAKVAEPEARTAGSVPGAEPDTAAAAAAADAMGEPGEPRRLPRARTINLLSISTSPTLTYDFVAAREEGRGFMTQTLSNTIRSDLLPGLNLAFTHELFELGDEPADGSLRPRTFSPFLTQLNTSFAIDQNFWLFRALGLTSRGAAVGDGGDAGDRDDDDDEVIQPDGSIGAMGATIPRPGGRGQDAPGMASGGWRASLNYVMSRRRPQPDRLDQAAQTVRGELSFQPTEHWTLSWSTGYSFTDNEFSDHFLTLSRDLHRWTANFHFIRAQNGNFAMRFNVHLRDNPDLKMDYDQHTTGADRRRAQEGF